MDPKRTDKPDKSVSKPRSPNSRNDHDSPNSVGATDDNSDEELISSMEKNDSLNDEKDSKNNNQGKIVNDENGFLENSERPGESEDGSI
jgi:hypothetical protein